MCLDVVFDYKKGCVVVQIVWHVLFLVFGFVFLIKGADFFVVSSSSIARKFNVSPLLIGLTLVAFGTSLPELAVSFAASISAARQGMTADIAMGNVMGSNIANLTLILGFAALVMPMTVRSSLFRKELPFLFAITIVFAVFSYHFQAEAMIARWEALILLGLFALYMYMSIKGSKNIDEVEEIKVINVKHAIIFLVIGLAGVSLGGWLVTTGAEFIAIELLMKAFAVEQSRATVLVGLSVVALGTSLPELVTSAVAAKKGENEIAIGNIIGSNIFNTLLIVGLAGIVTPLGISGDVLSDIYILFGIMIVVLIVCLTGRRVMKGEGVLLLVIYVSYITYIILRGIGRI
ncbi:MAG: sodium:calcium antiporter [Acholeplasmataceae bacterium]|nr:MAG: sodium:calcium antiporter [Acholeplasmataceae bacterium]